MEIDNKVNIKKLLCYNIVNNSKCVYKGKCMFAHNLDEQKKEPSREYIYNMIYNIDDLSSIDIFEDKSLLDELLIYTKECKNCFNKKCPGGYNCKFGACTKEVKICYNDLMHGKCYNSLNEDDNTIKRCMHGVHLTEKNLICYYQRVPIDIYSNEFIINSTNDINYNTKNNIISMVLNDTTIKFVKELTANRLNKSELIKLLNDKKKLNNILNKNDELNDLLDSDKLEELIDYDINNLETNPIKNILDNKLDNELSNDTSDELSKDISDTLSKDISVTLSNDTSDELYNDTSIELYNDTSI
jgi:hypothetical protein